MQTITETVEISELCRESGIPIYQTNINPITYSPTPSKPIVREDVAGLREAYMLHNVLSPEECQQFMRFTEKMGYHGATITLGNGMLKRNTDQRNNQRVMWQAQDDIWMPIYERILPHIDASYRMKMKDWKSYGLNERLRFYKYEKNQTFKPHFDGCYPRGNRDMSIFTFLIYLNDDFQGGRTTFFTTWRKGKRGVVAVQPVQGSALLFPHGCSPYSPEHEGSTVTSGIKYVLRSDLMFRVEEGASIPQNVAEEERQGGRVILYE